MSGVIKIPPQCEDLIFPVCYSLLSSHWQTNCLRSSDDQPLTNINTVTWPQTTQHANPLRYVKCRKNISTGPVFEYWSIYWCTNLFFRVPIIDMINLLLMLGRDLLVWWRGRDPRVGLFDSGPASPWCKHCNYWDRLELILNRTAKIYNYKTGQLEPRLQL